MSGRIGKARYIWTIPFRGSLKPVETQMLLKRMECRDCGSTLAYFKNDHDVDESFPEPLIQKTDQLILDHLKDSNCSNWPGIPDTGMWGMDADEYEYEPEPGYEILDVESYK